MAARGTLGEMIERLRQLINDTDSEATVFESAQLERFLDNYRIDVIQQPLDYISSNAPGGVVGIHTYHAPIGDWESNVVLTDSSGTEVEPDASDLQAGRWDFDADTTPPLYITGSYHDLYAAAADALEAWVAKVALHYDFGADGATYHRSQQAQALIGLSRLYRAMGRPAVIRMTRSDL